MSHGYEGCGDRQDALDDAAIEDTCHCLVCRASLTCGGSDMILAEVPKGSRDCFFCDGKGVMVDLAGIETCPNCEGKRRLPEVVQAVLCDDCAGAVHKAYLTSLAEAGLCEHGNDDDATCEDCRRRFETDRTRFDSHKR